MNKLHPFRFGLMKFSGGSSRQNWADQARAIEAAGYSSLLLSDHLIIPLAPIACMVAAADATTTLRIGSAVFGNDFRHPVFLAQEAAMIDLLSDGRLELGLGTGFYARDYEMSGIALDSPAVRVSRLEEAVHIIKGFFGEKPFDFTGQHYNVHGLQGLPKSVQKPHPPIAIGGGSRRILSFAAREADIVSVNIRTTAEGGFDMASLSADATAQKVAWVREAASERFDSLELNVLVTKVSITENPRQVARDNLQESGLPTDTESVDRWLESPSVLVGTIDQIVETLRIRRERYGFSYISIFEPMEPFVPVVERLAGQ